MNKERFLKILENLLEDIPKEEREEALQYYRDYFEDAGIEKESQVLRELGSPDEAAASIRKELAGLPERRSFGKSGKRRWYMPFLAVGLSCALAGEAVALAMTVACTWIILVCTVLVWGQGALLLALPVSAAEIPAGAMGLSGLGLLFLGAGFLLFFLFWLYKNKAQRNGVRGLRRAMKAAAFGMKRRKEEHVR